jgi:hypothetical protein
MTKTVNIEVTCDSDGEGGVETFGVVSEHRSDLPKPFNSQLQEWVQANFEGDLEEGETLWEAGEMEYEPNGSIVDFRKKS